MMKEQYSRLSTYTVQPLFISNNKNHYTYELLEARGQ